MSSVGAPQVLRVSRAQTALMAACGGAVMYVGFVMDFKHVSWADAKVMLLLGAAAASSAWLVSPVHGSRPRHSRLHLGMAFVLGITWMQILANEIVAVLEVRPALRLHPSVPILLQADGAV
jgi:phosphatidylserine synthase